MMFQQRSRQEVESLRLRNKLLKCALCVGAESANPAPKQSALDARRARVLPVVNVVKDLLYLPRGAGDDLADAV